MSSIFSSGLRPFAFPLLISAFCLLSPAFAQSVRPEWTWDGDAAITNEETTGPFHWSWQAGSGVRVSPETGLAQGPVTEEDGVAFEGLVRENVALRREVERALRQLYESRQAQATLEVQVRDLEQKRAALAASLREIRTSDEVLAELARIRAERENLAQDNIRLKERLDSAAMPAPIPPAPVTPATGSDLFKKIERENLDLKVELAGLKQATRETATAQARLEQMKHEQSVVVEQSIREKAELQARLEQLQEGKVASDRSAERWNQQAQAAEKEAQQLRDRVAEIEQEMKASKKPPTATADPAPTAEEALIAMSHEAPVVANELTAKALRLAQRGKYRDAEKLYLQALKGAPDSASIHFNLGILYQEGMRSPSAAVTHFKKYLELNPQALDADQVRAWINELEMGF